MAVTNQNSVLMANIAATPPMLNQTKYDKARLVTYKIDFTQVGVGDSGSTIRLFQMPQAGRICTHLSRLSISALGASTVAAIGHEAYSKPDGSVVALNASAMGSALSTVSATKTIVADWTTSPVDTFEPDGAPVIILTVTGGSGIPAAATVKGEIVVALP
jgi:hypothetical protein